MKKNFTRYPLLLSLVLILLVGCGSDSADSTPALNADNVNLIFVVTPDLAYHTL